MTGAVALRIDGLQVDGLQVDALQVVTTAGAVILDVPDLWIAPGEHVGIVGGSGAGKSTLARALVGEVDDGLAVSGRVLVGGRDVIAARPADLRRLRRRSITYLRQQPASSLNPAQRVGSAVGERLVPVARWHRGRGSRVRVRRVEALLEMMALPTDRAFLQRRTHQLSGGQAQRVALARALASNPSIIVLDEPTTDLDAQTRTQVLKVIADAAADATVIVVSHDHATITALADRVVGIRDGRLDLQDDRVDPGGPVRTSAGRPRRTPPASGRPLLTVAGLTAGHDRGGGGFVPALVAASLEVAAGSVVALVGASGSGKTTLARCIVGAHASRAGTIELEGDRLDPDGRRRPLYHRRAVQLIPQDPGTTLNTLHRVDAIVQRPAQVLRGLPAAAARSRAHDLLGAVGLPRAVWSQRAGTLSGGERQRVAIARALAAGPRLLVCDEITSALDAGSATRVLDLVVSLIDDEDLAVILISHDHALVSHLADAVLDIADGMVTPRGTVTREG